jgi:hypothetical protein
MTMKGAAAKGVSLPRRKAKPNALEKLPPDASVDELKTAAVHVSLTELEDRVADVRDSWETDSLFEDAFEELAKGNFEVDECEFVLFHFHSILFISRFSSVHHIPAISFDHEAALDFTPLLGYLASTCLVCITTAARPCRAHEMTRVEFFSPLSCPDMAFDIYIRPGPRSGRHRKTQDAEPINYAKTSL